MRETDYKTETNETSGMWNIKSHMENFLDGYSGLDNKETEVSLLEDKITKLS